MAECHTGNLDVNVMGSVLRSRKIKTPATIGIKNNRTLNILLCKKNV